jgi:hypothetical protein
MADLMSRIEGVKNKLKEADYIAVCQNISTQKCSFTTPNSLEFITTYSLYSITKNKVRVTITASNTIINESEVKVKPYMMRSVVFADIISKCNVIGYCPGVIVFKDKVGLEIDENKFFDGVGKIQENDIQKDIILRDLIIETISKKTILTDIAIQYDVLEGYEMCCKILGFTDERKSVD